MLDLFSRPKPVFILDLEGHKQVLAEIETRLKLAQQLFKEMQTWPTPVELWKKSWAPSEFGVFQQPELNPKPKFNFQKYQSYYSTNTSSRVVSSGKKVITSAGRKISLPEQTRPKINPQAYPVKYIPARCEGCGIDLVQGRALVNGDKVYCDKCNPGSSELMQYFTLTPEERNLNVGSTLQRNGRLYQITEMCATSLGTRVQARRLF